MEDARYLVHWHIIVRSIEMVSKKADCGYKNKHYNFETSKWTVLQEKKDNQKYKFYEHHNYFNFCRYSIEMLKFEFTYFDKITPLCFLLSTNSNIIINVSRIRTKLMTMHRHVCKMWVLLKHSTSLNMLLTSNVEFCVIVPCDFNPVTPDRLVVSWTITIYLTLNSHAIILKNISNNGWNSTVLINRERYYSSVRGQVNENWWPWLFTEKEA